ncbi:MAG TPA: hypothetical protein VKF81_11765 [Blastocatellia bacterium]|nr:hypothetical protein [Blastocatellia bacterium]
MSLRKSALFVVLLLSVAAVPTLAQGPLQKRIDFTINSPFELKKSGLVLPAGNYVLFEIDAKEPHLFALYRDNMRHRPIAMIWTMRTNNMVRWPTKTRLIMETDESSPQNYPLVEGWTVPGEDGWQVISAITSRRVTLAR